MPINYLNGDATKPETEGMKIIAHVCNDVGMWEAGFIIALRKWPIAKDAYRAPFIAGKGLSLSDVQFVPVEEDIVVANMVAQNGVGWEPGKCMVRYMALGICLDKVFRRAIELDATIHMPRIGCGLAGGEWSEVEKIMKISLDRVNDALDVFVYDLK